MILKRTYKDGLFRSLFNDKEKLLELYSAISGKHYPADTEIEIITLEDTIFGDIKNDLAFIVNNRLIILIEHQSTISPNLALRMFCYLAKEYEKLTKSKGIYSKRLIPLPTPELYVFYNGLDEMPLEQELKLSDAFAVKYDKISVEAVIKVVNVNYDKGAALLAHCQTLNEYSQFVHMIRQAKNEKNPETAIKEIVDTCIREGILKEYLRKYGGEIMSFLYEALTREECEAIREEDGFERGMEQGIQQGESLGEERFGKLTLRLITETRYDDLEKASKDKAYRNQLFEEFKI